MTYMINQPLKDFMDIWAHEVVELRTSLEYARQGEHSAREGEESQRKLHKEQMERADRLTSQLSAEKKHTVKLQNIIDSLKYDLEATRAAHTNIVQAHDQALALVDRIYNTITGDGTESAKVITVHQMITEARRQDTNDTDD